MKKIFSVLFSHGSRINTFAGAMGKVCVFLSVCHIFLLYQNEPN